MLSLFGVLVFCCYNEYNEYTLDSYTYSDIMKGNKLFKQNEYSNTFTYYV